MKFIWPVINLLCFAGLSFNAYNGDKWAAVALGVFAAFWYVMFLQADHRADSYCDLWLKAQKRSRSWM